MATVIRMDTGKLTTIVKGGSRKAMYRASALLMRMARQKIRYRSYRRASEPGMPPFKHRTGANSFSHSILFGVDASATTAVIGPQKEMKPDNPSGPVPHTLEFGGRTREGKNAMWFSGKAPGGISSESQVASFLKSQGYGPIFMNTNQGAVSAKAGKNSSGKIRKKRAPDFSRKSNGSYRMVYYFNVKLRSDRQARKAARNVVKYFGYPAISASSIAARPFMGPTLRENEGKIRPFWKDLT